ncbi:MAG: carboxymuconolactone decarboxylase family protein [Pseudomonadota bacterium]
MRLSEPRVHPQQADQWNAKAAECMKPFVENNKADNIFKTLTNHPDLMKRWMVFANHILFKSTLPAREREILILRIGYLCKAGYEYNQHVAIARECGMSEDEIAMSRTGPDTAGISELDKLLLSATDELHADAFITDGTWKALSEHFSTEQMMDVVFTVGQYNLVSMALNSLGVQLDAHLPTIEV